MKPQTNRAPTSLNPTVKQPRPYRPTASDLVSGSKLSRGELALFALLSLAVGLSFFEHAQAFHNFMEDLPEFATVIAELIRNAV